MTLFVYDNPALEFKYALIFLLVLAVLWSIPWKAAALWKSARQGDKIWFVLLILTNSVGILDILYLYVFSKKQKLS